MQNIYAILVEAILRNNSGNYSEFEPVVQEEMSLKDISYLICRLYPKDQGIIKIFLIANRYPSISCIKDKSIAACADVIRLFLLFENLRLTLAKNAAS